MDVLEAVLIRRSGAADDIARNQLAAQVCGNAHGLDDGTLLAAIVVRALALDSARPLPNDSVSRRELWQSFGVTSDSVSTTALALGLQPLGDEGLSRRLRIAAADADPVHLTFRDVARLDPKCLPPRPVLVCENPRVLELAAQRPGGRALVVCAMGNPATVVIDLLSRLHEAGCTLNYHGDFDWPGLRIAERIVTDTKARPWRMTADDYLAALANGNPGLPLEGPPTSATWDPALTEAMAEHGVALHEEALLPDLVDEWIRLHPA
jgi:uncharacterized protein (TIGR02679 family)